jgi:hypothetical protein
LYASRPDIMLSVCIALDFKLNQKSVIW